MGRTVGVEEELLLFDPTTREVVAGAPSVLKEFREHGSGRSMPKAATDELDQELFRHQLETRTDPAADLDDVLAQLVAARRTAGEAARATGLAAGAAGIVPLAGNQSVVTPNNDRYRDMVDTFGEIARTGGSCGMHVHTEVASDEEGVGVIDRIGPWLPVLLALSSNSPYVDGRDSGYASWRAQVWSRWPSAGPTEQFGSAAGYHEVGRTLIETGAARDPGMLYYDARLAVDHPTVEVRVCDVCTDTGLAVAIVALVRGLVQTAAADWAAGRAAPASRVEALRAAQWRASRFGMSDTLVSPVSGRLEPASVVAEALVAHVEASLDADHDLDLVHGALERAVSDNGARRQRAAYERTSSVQGVVDDLIARTEASWTARDLG